jgi:hypothetical protein
VQPIAELHKIGLDRGDVGGRPLRTYFAALTTSAGRAALTALARIALWAGIAAFTAFAGSTRHAIPARRSIASVVHFR